MAACRRRLAGAAAVDYRAAMRTVARFLQFLGLAIPPLAMFAQLAGNISTGQMLQFLVASVCLFGVGYLLQSYRGSE